MQAPFNYSITSVGSVFALLSVVCDIAGPLVGIVDDRTDGKFAVPIMISGILIMAIGYAFLGPTDWVTDLVRIEKSETNMLIGISLIGFGSVLGLIPAYSNIFQSVALANEDRQADATSALYNVMYAGGAFIGPSVAGGLGEKIGYTDSYTVFALFLLVMVIILIVQTLLLRRVGARNQALQNGGDLSMQDIPWTFSSLFR